MKARDFLTQFFKHKSCLKKRRPIHFQISKPVPDLIRDLQISKFELESFERLGLPFLPSQHWNKREIVKDFFHDRSILEFGDTSHLLNFSATNWNNHFTSESQLLNQFRRDFWRGCCNDNSIKGCIGW